MPEESRENICTLTMNPTVDKSATVGRVVANEKLRCDAPEVDPGGGGLNVSRVVHELGGSTTAVYPVGGHTGGLLQELMEREGVRQATIPIEETTRESITVTDAESGDQYRFVMPGPSLRRSEWEAAIGAVVDALEDARYVVASGSLPPEVPSDFYARLGRELKSLGRRLVVDSSGGALRAVGEEGAFLFKPNRREVEDLVGRGLRDREAWKRALEDFIAGEGAEAVVVSLGAEGAFFVSREGSEMLSVPDVSVKSRIGAGDSTLAGMVFALTEGRPLREAVLFGLAAGAAAVTTSGTKLCRRSDVESLFEEIRRLNS